MEYLVESHLGGYYISDEDPIIIEAVCEQCFDSDAIVASWTKGNREEEVISISNYLCGMEVNDDSYNKYLEYSGLDQVIDIKKDIQDMFFDFKVIVGNLNESGYIDSGVADAIYDIIGAKKDEWLAYINEVPYVKVLTR